MCKGFYFYLFLQFLKIIYCEELCGSKLQFWRFLIILRNVTGLIVRLPSRIAGAASYGPLLREDIEFCFAAILQFSTLEFQNVS